METRHGDICFPKCEFADLQELIVRTNAHSNAELIREPKSGVEFYATLDTWYAPCCDGGRAVRLTVLQSPNDGCAS
jgi:hypothetical protein